MILKVRLFSCLSVLLTLCICFSGCGFHLRGKVEVASDLASISVTGKYKEFIKSLSSSLRKNKVELASDAPYRLVVINFQETSDDRVTVAALEYYEKIFSTVTVQLETSDNISLFSPKEFHLKRHITGQENQLNSALVLRNNTLQTMRSELVLQVLRWFSGIRNEQLQEEEKRARSSKERLIK